VWEILDALTSLEKKSLIVADTLSGARARYHILETIRQYASEKFAEEKMGDTSLETVLRDRHLAFFLAQAREYGPLLKTVQITESLALLDPELDNLRAAITWALGKGNRQGAKDALGILTALDYFWAMRALYWETFPRFLDALEKLPDDQNQSAELKAWGFYVLSSLQADLNIGWETLDYLNQSVPLFRQVRNLQGLTLALSLRSYVIFRYNFFFPPDPAICQEGGIRDREESLAIVHDLSQVRGSQIQSVLAWVDCWIGCGKVFQRNNTEGRILGQKAQERFKLLGDRIGELYGWVIRLFASRNIGDGPEIFLYVDHAMELAKQINHKWFQGHFYEIRASIYYKLGKYTEFETNIRQQILLNQQMGTLRGEIDPQVRLGDHYISQHDIPKAIVCLRQALTQLALDVNQKDLYLRLKALTVSAKLALQMHQSIRAVKLLGFVEVEVVKCPHEIWVFDRNRLGQSKEKARDALDENEFQEAWQQGQVMTMDQAVALALSVTGV
jgi:hypothetical protein